MTELEAGLEAVLFAAGDAVPVDRLVAALETSREALLGAAEALENLYDFENRGMVLQRMFVHTGGGPATEEEVKEAYQAGYTL